MCTGIGIPLHDLPVGFADRPELAGRVYRRDGVGQPEVWFFWRHRPPLIPIWHNGRLSLARWGNPAKGGPLPYGHMTREESVRAGRWAHARPEEVDVPATYLEDGGVWTRVRHGLRGLLVTDPATGEPVVYVVCRPATRYYNVMTRREFQPVLIEEVI